MDACIPMEALGTLDALGSDDPQRLHVEGCARCSAMLLAYREFVRADAPRAASVPDADNRLAAFITTHVQGIDIVGGSRRTQRRWLPGPTLRWTVAAAVVVVGAVSLVRWSADRGDVALRGASPAGLTLETPRALGDGSFELRWSAVEGADAYEVVLLGDDLSEIFRVPVADANQWVVDRSTTSAGATRWQVVALREGGVISESTPADLPR